jgi:hypothetical protein
MPAPGNQRLLRGMKQRMNLLPRRVRSMLTSLESTILTQRPAVFGRSG